MISRLKAALNFLIKHKIKTAIFVALGSYWLFCLPQQLFSDPHATVMQSSDGLLLGAQIAPDGQWRFPETDSLPYKFKKCLIYFEDEYFYQHPGFNPVSIVKALLANIKAGKTTRGGSTLTQQLIRLAGKNKKRTYLRKLLELFKATRAEMRYSKDEILILYASYAPFGGNVVGLDAAAWRYFGTSAHQLSWAESATLAVLPNAPGLIHPGRNRELLRKKRNRLLLKLQQNNIIDSLTYKLAIEETLPLKPHKLPRTAPHLLHYLAQAENKGKLFKTTINRQWQNRINQLVSQHNLTLSQNQIHNAAVLVIDIETRAVSAYVANTPTLKRHHKDVDLIHAARSTGSTLKPFLYAAMLDDGLLLPESIVADVPTKLSTYRPENFDLKFSGAVTAKRALSRSLNVPAVRLLKKYGLQRFLELLEHFDLKTINKGAAHYGLSLILGGAESNLWDLCKTYAALGATVNHYTQSSGEYRTNEFREPHILRNERFQEPKLSPEKNILGAGSIYLMLEAMKEVNRPEGHESWEFFDSSRQIAWKTGTSFGNRDAWAIGLTSRYVVGVWVGNADGEGRQGLTGLRTAAPLLFDVFNILPRSSWFVKPHDALYPVMVCAQSGYLASDACPKKETMVPLKGAQSPACSFHHWIHLQQNGLYRVNSSCANVADIKTESWFILPPLMAYYYKKTNLFYRSLPPFAPACIIEKASVMDFIGLNHNARITLTHDLDGRLNPLVVHLAHSQPQRQVFWYLDDNYLGQTQTFHEMAIMAPIGKHKITAVDETGNEVKRTVLFE